MTVRRAHFEVKRETVEKGRTFSEDAMLELGSQMLAFVTRALIETWDERAEPPTLLHVHVEVEAS